MVMDRIQAISRGSVVYKDRGEKVVVDPLDRKKWAEGQIEWLIKQVNQMALRIPVRDI
jgi:hypothetical protein